MANDNRKQRVPFAFLEDIRRRFRSQFGDAIHSAIAFSFNEEFAPTLQRQMEFYNSDPSSDQIGQVRGGRRGRGRAREGRGRRGRCGRKRGPSDWREHQAERRRGGGPNLLASQLKFLPRAPALPPSVATCNRCTCR